MSRSSSFRIVCCVVFVRCLHRCDLFSYFLLCLIFHSIALSDRNEQTSKQHSILAATVDNRQTRRRMQCKSLFANICCDFVWVCWWSVKVCALVLFGFSFICWPISLPAIGQVAPTAKAKQTGKNSKTTKIRFRNCCATNDIWPRLRPTANGIITSSWVHFCHFSRVLS